MSEAIAAQANAPEAQDQNKKRRAKAFPLRRNKSAALKPSQLIAYDFETTRIQAGTPRPLYITAFGEHLMHYASRIDDMEHLQLILVTNFLTEENRGFKFVAWNGNNFDAYFVAAAMVTHPDYVLRPYLTRGKALRGLKVLHKADLNNKKAKGWEFLDGIAMTGLVGVKLSKFLEKFAPNHLKLEGVIDFDNEEFDPDNESHCEYAMRDSVGLYHGIERVQSLLIEKFEQPLAVTMGGACIKIFKRHIPEDVVVYPLPDHVLRTVRDYVMRGGYCYCVKRYQGPVWKYDINQAYAAAMRDARLPAGRALHSSSGLNPYAIVFIARIEAWNAENEIPFYYRTERNGRLVSVFGTSQIHETWITSIEYEQLKREGWRIRVYESFAFEGYFSMRDYVDKLERGRMAAPGGPSGAEGTIYKNVGNHSYGKTVERLEPLEYALAAERPEGYVPLYLTEDDPIDFTYYRHVPDDEWKPKDYHQPHLGSFITAHVRMVVRRAALLSPKSWLYADTDCVVFSSDVTASLDIDAKRYGAWKIEEAGTEYQIIAKKVYTELGDKPATDRKRSAKGMHARELTPSDFDKWFHGSPPEQRQVQRQNFLRVMRGEEMYKSQVRHGTHVPIDDVEDE